MYKCGFYCLILLLICTQNISATELLNRIYVEGNVKTKAKVIEQLSELQPGEELTNKMIASARAALISSGLFEEVRVRKVSTLREGYVDVYISVREKLSWFAVPSFSFSQDTLSGGGVIGESNLFGYNKKLIIFGDYGTSSRRGVIAYRDPSVLGSPLTLSFDGIVRWDRIIEYENRSEFRRSRLMEYGVTVLPGYRWSPRFVSFMGVYLRNINQELISEEQGRGRTHYPPLDEDGWDIAITMAFVYDDMRNQDGLVQGAKLVFETELSDNRFFSDFDYSAQKLSLQTGLIFLNDEYNWVSKLNLSLGQSLPYYKEFTLGGGNLRGFIRRQFRGDTRYSTNQDLVFPIHNFKRFLLRGSLFWDSGVIYFKDEKFNEQNWRNGVGGGVRIYLKGVVIPVFSFDVGWGIEERTYSTYLSIGGDF